MNQEYNTKYVTLGICKRGKFYLLLRLAEDYYVCPNDWDFLISRIYKPLQSDEENIVSTFKEHTNLNVSITIKGNPYVWEDTENELNWIIFPCLVETEADNVKLSKKFSEYLWLEKEALLEYDRLNYINTVINQFINKIT